MMHYLNLIKKIAKAVQKKNYDNPNVKTANEAVFDKVNEKIDLEDIQITNRVDRRAMFERMNRRIDEAQYENEIDENIETADETVFIDMKDELELLRRKLEEDEESEDTRQHSDNWVPHSTLNSVKRESQAITNSNGGSLQMTLEPIIGGSVNANRIPDRSLVKVIRYSDHQIILDNKKSRFVYVEYNGQQGWIPDVYLNFN